MDVGGFVMFGGLRIKSLHPLFCTDSLFVNRVIFTFGAHGIHFAWRILDCSLKMMTIIFDMVHHVSNVPGAPA